MPKSFFSMHTSGIGISRNVQKQTSDQQSLVFQDIEIYGANGKQNHLFVLKFHYLYIMFR